MSDLVERLKQIVSHEDQARRTHEDAEVAAVREELRSDYEQAKQRLPVLEKESPALLRELAKYREQTTGLAASVAMEFNRLAGEIHVLLIGGSTGHIHSASSADTTREGLRAFKELRYQEIADANQRRNFVFGVRQQLRSGDGALLRVRSLLGQIETLLRAWADSRESLGTPPMPQLMTESLEVQMKQQARAAGDVKIETNFDPRLR
jgi:phage-related tail protein